MFQERGVVLTLSIYASSILGKPYLVYKDISSVKTSTWLQQRDAENFLLPFKNHLDFYNSVIVIPLVIPAQKPTMITKTQENRHEKYQIQGLNIKVEID